MKIKIIIVISILINVFVIKDVYSEKNKILFKINNEIITSVDLLEESNFLRAINKDLQNIEKEIVFEISKKSLIRQKIKHIELKKIYQKLEVDEIDLKKLLVNYFTRYNLNTYEKVIGFFKEFNLNQKKIEEMILIEIYWNEFIFNKYSKNVRIDLDKIKNDLQGKKVINEYLLSEILFDLNPDENLENKFKLIKKIINNESFSEAALRFSISNSSNNGGKLDWIKETSLNKKIRENILNINIGNFTNPIVIPGGFLILKIEDKKQTQVDLNLENEMKIASQKQRNEQLSQYSTIYFNKISKNVEIKEY